MILRIYTKKDCHLCDDAKTIILKVAGTYANVQVIEIDIERDAELAEKFQYEIPVVFLEDQKLFKYKVDPHQLKKAIDSRLRR